MENYFPISANLNTYIANELGTFFLSVYLNEVQTQANKRYKQEFHSSGINYWQKKETTQKSLKNRIKKLHDSHYEMFYKNEKKKVQLLLKATM